MKTLITFFSAERGVTAKVARDLSEVLGADIFEIKPVDVYTSADLNWMNPLARCNREHIGKKDVPVEGRVENFGDYDLVLVGFPIWYGIAPNVVHTFCKDYDWSGKKIVAFATSGGSGIGRTAEKLAPYCEGGEIIGAKLVHSAPEVKSWIDELNL